jgi:hypothetical protein
MPGSHEYTLNLWVPLTEANRNVIRFHIRLYLIQQEQASPTREESGEIGSLPHPCVIT